MTPKSNIDVNVNHQDRIVQIQVSAQVYVRGCIHHRPDYNQ